MNTTLHSGLLWCAVAWPVLGAGDTSCPESKYAAPIHLPHAHAAGKNRGVARRAISHFFHVSDAGFVYLGISPGLVLSRCHGYILLA